MATRQASITITYRKPGTKPPIFVAGNFSNPAWQPHEMDSTLEGNEHLFRRVVYADEGAEIQYKFRIGHGDWWALKEDAETVSDGHGNLNNVLKVPRPDMEFSDDSFDSDGPVDDPCPMFDHECVDDAGGVASEGSPNAQHAANDSSGSDPLPIDTDPDLDDPRLEVFPSDSRDSIIAAMRRIETSTDEDRSVFEASESPVASPAESRSSSVSGFSPNPPRTEQPRGTLGSVHSDRAASMVSLQSIDEGLEEAPEDYEAGVSPKTKPVYDHKGEAAASPVVHVGPKAPAVTLELPSDEEAEHDEGISMGNANTKDGKTTQLRKRNLPQTTDRPTSSTSIRSIHEANRNRGWIQAFFHVLFIDWIGAFFSKVLFGNRRKAMLTVGTAVLFAGFFWKTSKDRIQEIARPWLDVF